MIGNPASAGSSAAKCDLRYSWRLSPAELGGRNEESPRRRAGRALDVYKRQKETMANVDSAKKRVRQTEKRTLRNKHVRTTVRSLIKKVRDAMAKGDKKAATAALGDAVKRVDQAVSKGVYHKNAGSRTVARLSAQVAALAA